MSRSLLRSLILVAMSLPLGCSSLDVMSLFERQKFSEASAQNPVADIVCLWEPADGRGLDALPARGFGGQLLFLTRSSAEPSKVNGEVRVYVFDDQGSVDEQAKPLHQFDFDAKSFTQYFYETSFGAAYQLFIPYTRSGSHEARCGLRVRYTPADGGPPVYSKMAEVTLPGAKPKTSAQHWNPEHRQLSADKLHGTGVPPTAGEGQPNGSDPLPTTPQVSSMSGSIPLPTANRTVQTRSRLQKLSAQLADSVPVKDDGVQQANYEVEAPADSTRQRYRLHRDEP